MRYVCISAKDDLSENWGSQLEWASTPVQYLYAANGSLKVAQANRTPGARRRFLIERGDLGGALQVHSAHYAPTDAERIQNLLDALKGNGTRQDKLQRCPTHHGSRGQRARGG